MDVKARNLKRPLEDAPRKVKKAKKMRKIDTRELQAKRPGFDNTKYSETSYYFENGLRKVRPYYFTYTSFAKARWVGKKLIEVFAEEFRALSRKTYEKRILNGQTTVNYEKVEPDYIVHENDLIANVVHRHEVPVSAEEISVIHKDDKLVVVNKPPSIPVHPCGRYRHNTIVFILAKEHNLPDLKTIHRLDRLTSGLLIIGRNVDRARELEKQIANRETKKTYVCRVKGEFPNEVTEVNEPIKVLSHKIGVCKVSAEGKESKTMFKRMSYNGSSSVVQCEPHHGRMHQIRVHLQYLGFPIMNDTLYNDSVFGPEKGKGGRYGKSDEKLIQDLLDVHNAENWLDASTDSSSKSSSNRQSDQTENGSSSSSTSSSSTTTTVKEESNADSKDSNKEKDPDCMECSLLYKDPKPQDLVMYLHALNYKGPDWEFSTPMPDWAKDDWTDPAEL